MFYCVNCRHEGETFHAKAVGTEQGALIYQAKCPECGSFMVNALPGVKEEDLRITAKKE